MARNFNDQRSLLRPLRRIACVLNESISSARSQTRLAALLRLPTRIGWSVRAGTYQRKRRAHGSFVGCLPRKRAADGQALLCAQLDLLLPVPRNR
jgi:hypothetical protein